jgi:excisionase family DNA binding protein
MTTNVRRLEPTDSEVIKELIPVRDAAHVLSVHVNTIRRWNDRGLIKAYRIGSRGDRRFSLQDVQKLQELMKSNAGNFQSDRQPTR